MRSDDLSTAVTSLSRAEKIWVVGFGDNYPLAHFARAQLIKVKPDIRMIPLGGFSVPEEFASIRGSDSVLALAIGRRTRMLRSILQSARLADAKTISVTDLASAGGTELADVTLRCRTSGLTYFDSLASPVSLITYLCMAVADRLGQNAVDRLRYIDSIHSDWGEPGSHRFKCAVLNYSKCKKRVKTEKAGFSFAFFLTCVNRRPRFFSGGVTHRIKQTKRIGWPPERISGAE